MTAAAPHAGALSEIVAATDFSPTSVAALEWSADLAAAHGARLVLAHAVPPAPLLDGLTTTAPEGALRQEQVFKMAASLLAKRTRVLGREGLRIETEIVPGPADEAIVGVATRRNADLLVVGTRGLTGFRRLLLGSTAVRVLQSCPIPVPSVHPEDAGRNRPLRRILVPCDFSGDAQRAIAAARALASGSGESAELVLLHAIDAPVDVTPYGPIAMPPGVRGEAQQKAHARLEEIAAPLRDAGLHVESRVREGYPPLVIEEEARAVDADLVAMGTRGLSGLRRMVLGSTAERLLPHAPCPVLTARADDPESAA